MERDQVLERLHDRRVRQLGSDGADVEAQRVAEDGLKGGDDEVLAVLRAAGAIAAAAGGYEDGRAAGGRVGAELVLSEPDHVAGADIATRGATAWVFVNMPDPAPA
ncbi:hypothetical protein [Streptomyces sp. NPDC001315]|uniref:hypothetical protein n=1 Tax=Streptomyces sp. NPDC001315 TaxID=3364562 RepID=UPI0036C7EB13